MFFMIGWVVKIEDLIIQRRLRWYSNAMREDINFPIRYVYDTKITGERKKGPPRKLWEECIKNDLKRMHPIERNDESELEQKLLSPASRPLDRTFVVVCLSYNGYSKAVKIQRNFES